MGKRFPALIAAHAVLFTAAAVSLAYCAYVLAHRLPYPAVRLAPAVMLIALPILLKSPAVARIIAACLLIGLGGGLYLGQFALMMTELDPPLLQAMRKEAWAARLPFDARSRVEVIDDLRSRGTRAYPPYFPYLLLGSPLKIDGRDVVPLGSMSNALTVCCNEGGQYLVYTTDEHGFVNPPALWSGAPLDIAIIGASFAIGESVDPSDSPAAQIRRQYPRTVTLGAGGNGPLLELGAVREYLPALRPKRVLWIFSESHSPIRLEEESHRELLLHYFDPSFRQGLIDKQDAIDQAIGRYFEDGMRQAEEDRNRPAMLRQFLLLESIRSALFKRITARPGSVEPLNLDASLYERVLRSGKDAVASWGGSVTLVYWPESSRYRGMYHYSPELRRQYDHVHESFVAAAKASEVAVIDLSTAFPDLPEAEAARNADYFYPYPAHFKPAGYRRATQAILNALAANP